MHDRQGSLIGTVLVFHDTTEQRSLMEQLSYQASHDALTGLVNRREFERRLQLLLETKTSDGLGHVLFVLDLDRFKLVNDTCGHAAGDGLLRKCAEIFQSYARQNDTVARLGGDEFGVILEKCPADKAVSIAEKMRQAVVDYQQALAGAV